MTTSGAKANPIDLFSFQHVQMRTFLERLDMDEAAAEVVAMLFVLMNVVAPTLGGGSRDRFAGEGGLTARWLVIIAIADGIALLVFSRRAVLSLAIARMLTFFSLQTEDEAAKEFQAGAAARATAGVT